MAVSDVLNDRSFESGVLDGERAGAVLPPEDLWREKKNGLVVIECPQRIPCNPCNTSCPTGAVKPFADINDVPAIDYAKCTGCGLCVAKCPGLACFVIDRTFAPGRALIKLPHEMQPVPGAGDTVECLNRTGEAVCTGRVEGVAEPLKDRTRVVSVSVGSEFISEVRAIRVVS